MDLNHLPPLSLTFMKGRKAPPSHCLFKIQSFSLLSKASVEKYTTEPFEAGGYKWTLSIYPTGNKERDGQDHISIYLNLMLQGSSSFPIGWEVKAIVNFFVYDFLQDEYLSTEDGSVRHFHVLRTEWGIPKFMNLATFNEPSNGYLIDDSCGFGAEIFIVKSTCKGDYLSIIDEPLTLSYSWKFENFSYASSQTYYSEPFIAGNYKWKLIFYPNGCAEAQNNSISLFLSLDYSTLPTSNKLYVYYILRVRDQISGQHAEIKFYKHLSRSDDTWGSRQFVSSAKFKDPKKGFLVGNSCILEAEIKVMGLLKPLDE